MTNGNKLIRRLKLTLIVVGILFVFLILASVAVFVLGGIPRSQFLSARFYYPQLTKKVAFGPDTQDHLIHPGIEVQNFTFDLGFVRIGGYWEVDQRLHDAIKEHELTRTKRLIDEAPHLIDVPNDSGNTPLHLAVIEKDAKIVELLLGNGANVQAVNEGGKTPLHIASVRNADEIVRLLLHHGATIDFYIAAAIGDTEAMERLLNEGKDINGFTHVGQSPLHYACTAGKLESVEFLLAHGAIPDVSIENRWTALHAACANGNEQIVRLLLQHGCDPTAKIFKNDPPIQEAIYGGHLPIVKILLEKDAELPESALYWASGDYPNWRMIEYLLSQGADPNGGTDSERNPLSSAALSGEARIVEALLEAGAEPDARDSYGRTPLMRSGLMRNEKVVDLLLSYGADINARSNGEPIIHQWISHGNVAGAKLLIENGADINSLDKEGRTPLVAALWEQYLEIYQPEAREELIAFLKDRGGTYGDNVHSAAMDGNDPVVERMLVTQPDAVNSTYRSFSPIHLAAKYGHLSIVELLLKKGALTNSVDENGFTPLSWALRKHHTEISDLLRKSGATYEADLRNAALDGNLDLAKELLRKGAKPTEEASWNLRKIETPLYLACEQQEVEMVKLFLEAGVDASSYSTSWDTPLHAAAKTGNVEILKLLLGAGAHPDSFGFGIGTPLQVAVKEGHIAAIKLLLEQGASINTKFGVGYTPAHTAVIEGNLDLLTLLLDLGTDLDTRGTLGNSLLHEAAIQGQLGIIEYLLDEGLEIDMKNEIGNCPGHEAAKVGQVEVVEYLLDKGFDVNARGEKDRTMLMLAAEEGQRKVVELLLKRRGDPNVTDWRGENALDRALLFGRDEIALVLQQDANLLTRTQGSGE